MYDFRINDTSTFRLNIVIVRLAFIKRSGVSLLEPGQHSLGKLPLIVRTLVRPLIEYKSEEFNLRLVQIG